TELSPTVIHTLSLHDALPISFCFRSTTNPSSLPELSCQPSVTLEPLTEAVRLLGAFGMAGLTMLIVIVSLSLAPPLSVTLATMRSEEHTSELQSRSDLVCRLL